MKLTAVLRIDVRLQRRQGFLAAYGFIVVVYTILLLALPEAVRWPALPPVLLTETAVVGFFFAGTRFHLERVEGTLGALAVTPLRPLHYVLSKGASLAGLASVAALAIAWGVAGGRVRPLVLLAGAVLASAFFSVVGLAVSTRFASLERFALWGGLLTAGLGLPVLPHLGIASSPLWVLHPTYPSLALLTAGLGSVDAGGAWILAMVALQLAWLAGAVRLARDWVARFGFGRARAGG